MSTEHEPGVPVGDATHGWTASPDTTLAVADAGAVEPGAVEPVADPGAVEVAVDRPWDLIDDTPLPPRRPKVVTTTTWVLFGVLLAAGGFAAGTKVGRDHAPTSTSGAQAGANGAARAGGQTGAPTAGQGAAGGGAFPAAGGAVAGGPPAGAGAAGAGAAGAGATFGQVKLVDNAALYIQDSQGNIVKVTLAAGGTITVTKPGTLADLKVGENVLLQGTASADGATFSATAITPAGALGGRNRGQGQTQTQGQTPPGPVSNG